MRTLKSKRLLRIEDALFYIFATALGGSIFMNVFLRMLPPIPISYRSILVLLCYGLTVHSIDLHFAIHAEELCDR